MRPEEVVMYSETQTINFAAVPQYIKDDLAEATIDAVKRFLAQPGGKEILEARTAAREARKAKEAAAKKAAARKASQ